MNEEFEREMNYKSPSQVAMEEQAREFADGQEEDRDGWVTVRSPETAKYITVLDFEVGKVFQYDIGVKKNWNPDHESCEKFLTDVGHRLNNCEWMVHEDNEIVTP
jgi:hypothetical protein